MQVCTHACTHTHTLTQKCTHTHAHTHTHHACTHTHTSTHTHTHTHTHHINYTHTYTHTKYLTVNESALCVAGPFQLGLQFCQLTGQSCVLFLQVSHDQLHNTQGEIVSVSLHMTTVSLRNTPGTNGQCLAPYDYSIAQQHTRDKWSVSCPTWLQYCSATHQGEMVSVLPHMTTVLLSNTPVRNGQCLAPHDYSIAQLHTREKWSVSRPTWLQYRSATHQGEMVSVSPHMTTVLLSNTPVRNGQCLAPHDYSITQQHTREKWPVSRPTWL